MILEELAGVHAVDEEQRPLGEGWVMYPLPSQLKLMVVPFLGHLGSTAKSA